MDDGSPILWWVRRDLRLSDNPGLAEAAATGRPVIPVFLNDEGVAVLGAAPRWRLGEGLAAFARALAGVGSRLVLRDGPALPALERLVAETGATAVWWGRLCDPVSRTRDAEVKAALKARGLEARSIPGHLLHEPWEVKTGQGGFYRVYTPFWRAVAPREVPAPVAAPAHLRAPDIWPDGAELADWRLGAAMGPGAEVVAPHACVGEQAAHARLAAFVAQRIDAYDSDRDRPDRDGTSGLSENLSLGEISPRTVWHAGLRAREEGRPGAETFLKELVWREFAWHLLYHTPEITERNWRPEWEGFPWSQAEDAAVLRWKQGRTGIALVDAAMREMYVTGRMHNRGRMIVASYLTKHMLVHWKVGMDWFAECLIDWDPASNAMGWQWAAGSGPDATPYFRIFNPDTQAEKFDPEARYRRRFVAELSRSPGAEALAFHRAAPARWGLTPDMPYPAPLVGLKEGRQRALDAYGAFKR
ncbi:cryptochrome/photolyase family protein [Rhodobaculum claviforme]|uniref:Deoxyribodipyrimidine photolyase n=1 Tax=Rhodobaculum claviforme TaxID=1549854 RepID=A0A934WJB2_9RHOB|nr:deoxyribodipyrimidine photo-lyase [Rhodobaculum claviforme]MBK5927752.1 deoxyribodipyrimidine photolyase [Rhodobaculum claviforme]